MDDHNGFWHGVIKPELGGEVEQLLHHALLKGEAIRPIPEHTGGTETDQGGHAFPTGNEYAKSNVN